MIRLASISSEPSMYETAITKLTPFMPNLLIKNGVRMRERQSAITLQMQQVIIFRFAAKRSPRKN